MQMLSSVVITDKKREQVHVYELVSFSKTLNKPMPIVIKYDLKNNTKGSIEIRCKQMKIEI